jgi:hypothetical protein
LEDHTNKARAKNSETNSMAKTTGAEIERFKSPAFLGEVVGHMPYRPQQRHVQGELHWAVAVMPVMLEVSTATEY